MKVTYYGHSCFGMKVGGKTLLFDPFIRANTLASSVKVEELKPDVILLSHGHWDHMADAVEIAKQSNALVIANFEIVTWLQKEGISNCHPMNIGGGKNFDWGHVKMVQALHSSTLPDGTHAGMPGGFVIDSEDANFYYAGDTALTLDFQLIGETYELDFAFLPIGDNFTMGIDDAIICADFVQCERVIGMHYNTFPPIQIDTEEAVNRFREEGLELILLPIGEEKEI